MASKFGIRRNDYFPNYMSWSITQTGNDDFTTDKIFTPIPRSQQMTGNKAIVMELLWMEVDFHNMKLNAADEELFSAISTGGVPTKIPTINEGNCISYLSRELCFTTSGAAMAVKPAIHNMQTNDGYGVLLGTDAFHASVDSLNTGIANQFHFRLYYRFVQIPITEFIGLVQSQQTS